MLFIVVILITVSIVYICSEGNNPPQDQDQQMALNQQNQIPFMVNMTTTNTTDPNTSTLMDQSAPNGGMMHMIPPNYLQPSPGQQPPQGVPNYYQPGPGQQFSPGVPNYMPPSPGQQQPQGVPNYMMMSMQPNPANSNPEAVNIGNHMTNSTQQSFGVTAPPTVWTMQISVITEYSRSTTFHPISFVHAGFKLKSLEINGHS